MFISNPQFTNTNIGEFIEVVNVQYDPVNNQTYADLAFYEKDSINTPTYLFGMQPRPYAGQLTKQEILQNISQYENDPGITIVGLQ